MKSHWRLPCAKRKGVRHCRHYATWRQDCFIRGARQRGDMNAFFFAQSIVATAWQCGDYDAHEVESDLRADRVAVWRQWRA
jgi:hypothetical protein